MSTSRTVIICTPAGEAIDWFTASEVLDWHKLPTGTPLPQFPVRHRRIIGWFTRWSQRHLVRPERRFGAVTRTAGGRVGRLDLTAAVAAAHQVAAHRWRVWAQVVRTAPVARSWADFLAQHTKDPQKLSLDEARRRFEAQPRVLAMLAYNAHPNARAELDPYELDAYQAGEATYTAVHWQHAVTGDLVITDDGRLIEPASTSLADRLRFQAEAAAYVHKRGRKEHLIAVTIAA
ncbi:hypothetical protein KZZ52_33765 [Dactylosporangium sp. AC04546]|uniref:hypothetical protein n=1 Tax=Dactylosporangium sp. AC04546 TaxID=2862460 RepID=UPI001EDD04AB|nr:hypothetical protein [Dactylosporangium sp. AC04546]WVK78943.1 hypothetical protein KZZ52_33765 [Dactylosporangium sp. AC04546]